MINFIVLDNPFDCPFSLNHIVADIRIKSFRPILSGYIYHIDHPMRFAIG